MHKVCCTQSVSSPNGENWIIFFVFFQRFDDGQKMVCFLCVFIRGDGRCLGWFVLLCQDQRPRQKELLFGYLFSQWHLLRQDQKRRTQARLHVQSHPYAAWQYVETDQDCSQNWGVIYFWCGRKDKWPVFTKMVQPSTLNGLWALMWGLRNQNPLG